MLETPQVDRRSNRRLERAGDVELTTFVTFQAELVLVTSS